MANIEMWHNQALKRVRDRNTLEGGNFLAREKFITHGMAGRDELITFVCKPKSLNKSEMSIKPLHKSL